MPQARHDGSGVCAFAVAGSKLEGTGFEKLHMVQTQVAALAGDGSAGASLRGLSDRGVGDAVLFLGEPVASAGDLDWKDARLIGFGISVTFAEDFRKPACITEFSAGLLRRDQQTGGRIYLT